MSCSCAALGPEVEPVPVCDAASAVSPACIALCVPSGIRSVLDEAEERGKQLLIREPNNKNLTDFLQEKCSYVTWLVKLVIWPWSLSTCRLKSSFSSFIRSRSLLSFLKSSSKIFTWWEKHNRVQKKGSFPTEHYGQSPVSPTCSFKTAIWVRSSCFFRLLAASAKLAWPGGCCEDEGECKFKASSRACRGRDKVER